MGIALLLVKLALSPAFKVVIVTSIVTNPSSQQHRWNLLGAAQTYVYGQNSGISFASGPAEALSTDRSAMNTRPQTQPTIFGVDYDLVDNPGPTKADKLALETTKGRNVVIFGDSGVGKSSLINMLAGRKTAQTSNGVLGCTFQSRQYPIAINGEKVNIWDTAGLDEGTRGRVAPEIAEKNLNKLLRELRGANGIHLLVYCIRGPSVRKSLARNYTIFYSAICRKKVPIVAVVTGLENEPMSMEDWWTRGEKEAGQVQDALRRSRMRYNYRYGEGRRFCI
ncbi:P-loop containing nucleoside triphosphate hydrolase protein [Lanmaoa asiatica]|nr:P-loop containing nucleoside triphosphate hydrolase protein [Lanmaoa asiatica]